MSYIKKLLVQKLKIDQSFVRGMALQQNDAIIVKSTIELGQNFGIEVVAEGVEEKNIYELLRRLGCDQAQGFHISRPLPADEFEKWLRKASVGNEPYAALVSSARSD